MEPTIEEVDETVAEMKLVADKEVLTNQTTEINQKQMRTCEAENMANEIDDVTIIILCWNNLKYTRLCIDSIRKHTNGSYQLIAVDQGSTDGTMQYLEQILTGDRDILIWNRTNTGFSGGNNQALKLAGCKHVLFLNNDCEIRKEHWLKRLIEANLTAGLVGAICAKATPNYKRKTFKFVGLGKEEDEWSYIEGWCLLGRRDLLLTLGGFDERFNPIYSEDADLSFRVKKRGIKIKAIPGVVFHHGNRSEKLIQEHFGKQGERSNKLLYDKWIDNEQKSFNTVPSPKQKNIKIKKQATKIPTILIRRKGAKGDVLMTTPIIKELKKKYPESLLVYETDCPDILKNNPCIDHTERHISKLSDYDIVLTPRYEDAPGENAIDVMAKQCGVKLVSRKMDLFLTEDHAMWAKSKINPSKKYIAFHTGRTWISREWPIERFNAVGQHFLSNGWNIIELGDKSTNHMGLGKDCRGCSIKQTAALIKECQIFIGVDSVCSNIAKAVGTPACTIYGCASPSTRVADAIEYPVWIDDLECKGCRDRTSAEFVECQQQEIYCLTMITPSLVIKTVEECIKKELT
jgi:ADP-heptose:LPS heptosyltransferase